MNVSIFRLTSEAYLNTVVNLSYFFKDFNTKLDVIVLTEISKNISVILVIHWWMLVLGMMSNLSNNATVGMWDRKFIHWS